MSQTVEAVLERAMRGDPAAFEEVVTLYERLVYNIAYRVLGNSEDAGDVTQESFVRLYKNIRSLEDVKHLKPWLCRVAHNLCIDELRRRKARPSESLDAAHELEDGAVSRQLEDKTPGPEEAVLLKEELEQLERAIAKLPDEYRVMIVMRDLSGLSYQEISEATQLEMGTVKSRLSRARARLREVFVREQSELRIVK